MFASKIIQSRNYGTRALKCCQLSNRSLIRVQGAESADLLQGLMTNDMNHLSEDSSNSIFAMFLNTQGRVMFDTFIIKENPEEYLIDVDSEMSGKLVKHLKMYKVRRKINISEDSNLGVYALFDPKNLIQEVPEDSNQSLIYRDNRLKNLGFRSISNSLETNCDSSDFKLFRYQLGISEGSQEITFGKVTPLEFNLVYMHGISFHKGCYLGQELTARTHHTGIIRKRIMPLIFSQNNATNIDKILNADGKTVGSVKGCLEKYGIGLCRIEECFKEGSGPLKLENSNIEVQVKIPDWWPPAAPKTPQNR